MKYRKKPIEVEAVQYLREENIMQAQDFFGKENGKILLYDDETNDYFIHTLEGDMHLTKGDWIIRGVKGEYYPIKSDIFEATYEPVTPPPTV